MKRLLSEFITFALAPPPPLLLIECLSFYFTEAILSTSQLLAFGYLSIKKKEFEFSQM